MAVRTRIEPAPSGSIHVGNARTALFSWLIARKHSGQFILRIADTDQKRVSEDNYLAVLEDLRWLGLDWDEGPEIGGDYGPYRQSERMEHYARAGAQLLESGAAYRCYCTPDELDHRRKEAQKAGRSPGYDGRCRDLNDAQRAALEREGRAFSVRFRVPEHQTIGFSDVVLGAISTETDQMQDFVIQRSDGSPTYMLAVTVDDLAMKMTHVIRGNDLVASTPRQILMREALGVTERPIFAHLPLLVAEGGKPLSKRWGDVSVAAYREQGFLPEAMVNYLALLGWSFDDKTNIFSREELIDRFSLERVGKNPAAFDVPKLEWLNMHYVKGMDTGRLAELLVPFCKGAGFDVPDGERGKLEAITPLLVERLKRLEEAPPMVRFLFERVEPDDKARKALDGQQGYLTVVADRLEASPEWTTEAIEAALRALAEQRELKPKKAFQPVRAIVTGTLVSPPLFESLEILGREETLARLRSESAGG